MYIGLLKRKEKETYVVNYIIILSKPILPDEHFCYLKCICAIDKTKKILARNLGNACVDASPLHSRLFRVMQCDGVPNFHEDSNGVLDKKCFTCEKSFTCEKYINKTRFFLISISICMYLYHVCKLTGRGAKMQQRCSTFRSFGRKGSSK